MRKLSSRQVSRRRLGDFDSKFSALPTVCCFPSITYKNSLYCSNLTPCWKETVYLETNTQCLAQFLTYSDCWHVIATVEEEAVWYSSQDHRAWDQKDLDLSPKTLNIWLASPPRSLKMLYGSGAKWLNFSEDLNAYLTRYTVKEKQTGVQSLARRLYSVFSKWRDDELKRICS